MSKRSDKHRYLMVLQAKKSNNGASGRWRKPMVWFPALSHKFFEGYPVSEAM